MGSLSLLKSLPYIIAVLVIGVGLWYFGHVRYEAGYTAAQSIQAKAVVVQNEKVDKQVKDATGITEKHTDAITIKDNSTEQKFDNAAANVQPVRLCKPAPTGREMRTVPNTSGPTISTANSTGLLPAAEPDIAAALVMLARNAQRDNNYAVEYNAWYTEQLAKQLQNK